MWNVRRAAGRGLQRAVAAGVLGLLALGCRTSTVAVQNLDEVLTSNNRFHYKGRTTNVWRDLFRTSVGALKSIGGAGSTLPDEKVIQNPTRIALKNLLALAVSTEGNDAWRWSEQVRTYARYAAYAPSKLCRERAIFELVPHARRLGVTEPHVPKEINANAPELIEALDGLVDATRRIVAETGAVSTTASLDFEAAIEVLERTPVEIEGGSRLLRAIGPFLKKSGLGGGVLPRAQRERLVALSEKVQKALVTEALALGLGDPTDLVMAAAVQSNVAVYGEAFAMEALLALVPSRRDEDDPMKVAYGKFDVPQVPIDFEETIVATCEVFERSGLPSFALEPTALGVETRGTIFAQLWTIAINDLMYSARSRHGAMGALRTVSGGALDTLRSEEWDAWFREVAPQLEAELNSLLKTEAGAAAPPDALAPGS